MKKLVLYFMLLVVAVPAAAQPGLFGSHSSSHSHHSRYHRPSHDPYGPMFTVGNRARQPLFREVPSGVGRGMDPRDFDEACRILSNEVFDGNRLETAKRINGANPMSTRQIAEICRLFTYDTNRLDFAKFAYRHCVDPNNYFLLDEVFTYSSSRDELHEFIRH